jgi:hypothetical protein
VKALDQNDKLMAGKLSLDPEHGTVPIEVWHAERAKRRSTAGTRPPAVRELPPPNDEAAERAVISAMLLSPETIPSVLDVLKPHQFFDGRNRTIAESIHRRHTEGVAVDTTTVASDLRDRGALDAAGGTMYIALVTDATPQVGHVLDHARIVAQKAQSRELAFELGRLETEARLGVSDPAGIRGRMRELAAEEAPARSFVRLRVADIFAPLAPVDWLAQGLDLCPGAANLLAGFGFSGKTLAAQDLAISVATGKRAWGAFSVREGRVLHIDWEQGPRLTSERYQRLAAAHMLAPQDLEDRLSVVTRPRFYLDQVDAEEVLTRECEGHVLLVLDSLRAACPTIEENDSGVRIVLDMLGRVSERTGVVPVVIHHARKPSQDKTGGARMAIRGSGAIYDACASVLVFEGRKGRPTLVAHEKARTSGICAEDFELTISDVEVDGNQRGGLSVTASAATSSDGDIDGDAARQEQDARVLEIIGANPGVNVRDLRGLARPMRNTDIDDAVARLIASKKVETKVGTRGAIHHFPGGQN